VRTPRFLVSGAVAGAGSAFAFAALHRLLISDIWFSLIPMMVAGALCGLSVAWTYGMLFNRPSAATWVMYNVVYVVLFVLLGVASVMIYDPITTISALMAANEPPRQLIRRAMPLTLAFTLGSAIVIALLWGRTLLKLGAVLLTCTLLVAFLGLNVSVIGLVELPSGTAYLVAELFGLILAINLVYVAVFLLLERRALLGMEIGGRTSDRPAH
jgi:hypothetical protein